jgi:MerR family transcriptional regulator, Zn(II)-responsive regulator of zntA
MMLVHELSKRSNTTTDAIRFYTRIGLLQPVRDPVNAYKHYNESDLKKLEFIIQAKQLGFKLNEISSVLKESQEGISPCASVKETIQKRIIENKKLLSEKMALQSRMEEALTHWKELPDDSACEDTICFLIDSFFETQNSHINNRCTN